MSDLHLGDCRDVMAAMPANSVDTIITDPPYGLEFMGKDWDHDTPGRHFWEEALRVAKPGAMLLAFGGTRTFHRLTVAIEDAGWEIRDCLMWLYGAGFPKSHDISKAIDKAAGAEREVVGKRTNISLGNGFGANMRDDGWIPPIVSDDPRLFTTSPATDAAREWHGWGTALKPAWEPIILAMKPLDGTFAQNAQKWGVSGLNIDGGRIAATPNDPNFQPNSSRNPNGVNLIGGSGIYGKRQAQPAPGVGSEWATIGRWPANLLLDEEAAAMLDEQSGDAGGASRFYYVAKASRCEREQGLEERLTLRYGEKAQGPLPQQTPSVPTPQRNHHPTVKPIALMEYLCTLTATPTGGVVLDPFMGSGSTGIAALKTGRTFIGIEQNEEYLDIARRRLDWWARQLRDNDKPLPLWVGDIADNEPEAGGER